MIPVGTKIKFTRELSCDATGDHPAFLFASKGQLGEVTGYGTREGYWVKADNWPAPFGASENEFVLVEGGGK